MNQPLISCLCITKQRVPLLKRAIQSFLAQTYSNKELLIVYESDDWDTKKFLENQSNNTIKIMEIQFAPDITLGALRNLAIQRCQGDYFCQWDDDDWYHEKRLEFQMNVINESGFPASILMHWLVFDSISDRAYISPFWHWEGSILCDRRVVHDDCQYDNLAKGEDTPFVKKLFKKHMVFPVMMPKLYIYVYHSKNTWEYEHWHNNIISKSRPLSLSSSQLIKDILSNKYSVAKASSLIDEIKM